MGLGLVLMLRYCQCYRSCQENELEGQKPIGSMKCTFFIVSAHLHTSGLYIASFARKDSPNNRRGSSKVAVEGSLAVTGS